MSCNRMEAKNPAVTEPFFHIHQSQGTEPVLSRAVQAQIGRRLRVLFEDEAQPVPDEFQELLSQIDARLGSTADVR